MDHHSGNRDRPQRRGFRGTAENAKTKICMRWQNGECRFGDRCNFAHGDDELRQLPPRHDAGPGRGRGRGRYGDYHNSRDDGYGGGRGRGHHHHQGGYREGSAEHQAWVQSGCPVPGPNGWTQYSTPSGEKYYHNSNTDETQWDVPVDWVDPQ
mmetsp:Transcript_11982/g.24102  ORF Transcript_11982/g.24102 Transcript_11982/m.24102 type:complete len:153 (+) Transcript_11982:84-542(+)